MDEPVAAPLLRESASALQSLRAPALRPAVVQTRPTDPAYQAEQIAFQGIPSIESSPQGRLWAAWYGGGTGEGASNFVLATSSRDGGASWSGIELAIDPPGSVRAFDPVFWRDPRGRLWLFWSQAHTLHDGAWGVWAINTPNPDAEQPVWSQPRRLADGIMLNKPFVNRQGHWLFPISLPGSIMLKKELGMLPPERRAGFLNLATPEELSAMDDVAGGWVYRSLDQGQSLEPLGRARVPEAFRCHYEHMLAEKPDGTLWMMLRAKFGIGRSESSDGGLTWSEVIPLPWPHPPTRFFLGRLASGRLLLIKHGDLLPTESAEPPKRERLTAFLSEDEGESWKGGLLLDERECSYPDATQSPDGTVHVIYDHGRSTTKEILLASLKEQHILQISQAETAPNLRQIVHQGLCHRH